MGDVSISGSPVFILLALASRQNELASCLPPALLCLRFEIDLSRLPINERQLYNHVLDPGKGRLVCLVTLRPCWGVSISDIETAPLEKADERDSVEEKFVSSVLISSCGLLMLMLLFLLLWMPFFKMYFSVPEELTQVRG